MTYSLPASSGVVAALLENRGLGCDNAEMTDSTGRMANFTPNYIRAWRQHRKLSLAALAAKVKMDKGNLSKVENAINPWNQAMMENIADALECSVSDLLVRDPADPTNLWSIRQRATDEQWEQVAKVAEALVPFKGK